MADHVNVVEWHIHPFRAERWYAVWAPGLERCLAFGATSYSLIRAVDDPLHFRQTTIWADPEDFERYWASDEVAALREQVMSFYNKPLAIGWHRLLVAESVEAPTPG
jgi:quinol monooxygenase YgiN